MIGFRNVTHPVIGGGKGDLALDEATFVFPPECVALLCPDPLARRVILDLLTASMPPEQGRITWKGRVSWPIGRVQLIRSHLTGFETIDFYASLYDLDRRKLIRFVSAFPYFEASLDARISNWPMASSAKFAMILALTAEFDIYVCDGTLWLTNETGFNEAWQAGFKSRLVGKTAVISSIAPQILQTYCTKAVVAENGGLRLIDNLARGLIAYPQRPDPPENPRSMATLEQDDSAE